MTANQTGAVDISECPRGGGNKCRCEVCSECGFYKHTAIHGPFIGQLPGSQSYGHDFRPPAQAAIAAAEKVGGE